MQSGLREIDPNDKDDISTISRLHEELLDWGPISELGSLFLKQFVYSHLVHEKLIKAAIYEVEGRAAGFIAYTAHSITFHREAIKKHWMYVSYLMLISIVKKPAIALKIFKAIRLMLSRRTEDHLERDPSAEILAIGVLPEFRSPKFIYDSGLRISEIMLAHAASYFRSLGLRKMRAVVDKFNKPALFFYHNLGGQFEPFERAGDSMVQIWFDLCHLDE